MFVTYCRYRLEEGGKSPTVLSVSVAVQWSIFAVRLFCVLYKKSYVSFQTAVMHPTCDWCNIACLYLRYNTTLLLIELPILIAMWLVLILALFWVAMKYVISNMMHKCTNYQKFKNLNYLYNGINTNPLLPYMKNISSPNSITATCHPTKLTKKLFKNIKD